MTALTSILVHSRALQQERIIKTVAGVNLPRYRRLAAEEHYTSEEIEALVADLQLHKPYRDALSRSQRQLHYLLPEMRPAAASCIQQFLNNSGGLGAQTLFNGILGTVHAHLRVSETPKVASTDLTYARLEWALVHIWQPEVAQLLTLLDATSQPWLWSTHYPLSHIIRPFLGYVRAAPLLQAILEQIHRVPFNRAEALCLPQAIDLISGDADPEVMEDTLRKETAAELRLLATRQSLARKRCRSSTLHHPTTPRPDLRTGLPAPTVAA